MTATAAQRWLERLGYWVEPAVLHRRDRPVAETHPYALEIRRFSNPAGAIRAQAVFDVASNSRGARDLIRGCRNDLVRRRCAAVDPFFRFT